MSSGASGAVVAGAERSPALDGVRAVAVCGVLVFHLAVHRLLPGGYLGVDVFFVLSGYLITTSLLVDFDQLGTVDYRRFYARRALRLLPALAAALALGTAVVLAATRLHEYRHGTLASLPWSLLYVENWRTAVQIPTATASQIGLFGHVWSLSVEEQFYLAWPLVLVVALRCLRDRRLIAGLVAAAAAAEAVCRCVVLHHGWSLQRAYFGTDLHSDGLLLGSAIGLWVTTDHARGVLRRRRRLLAAVGAPAGVLLVAAMELCRNDRAWGLWAGCLAADVLSAAVVLALLADPGARLARVLAGRALVWLGARSYGLYLWHYPILNISAEYRFPGPAPAAARDVVAIASSVAAAAVSWRVIEAPCNRLRRRLRPAVLPVDGVRHEVATAARTSEAAGRSVVPALR